MVDRKVGLFFCAIDYCALQVESCCKRQEDFSLSTATANIICARVL